MTAVVVDSSALLAIALQEEDHEAILAVLLGAETRLVSALSVLESSIVVTSRKGIPGHAVLSMMFQELNLEVVALDRQLAALAHDTWLQYGKGRHPAGLNMGDCCSYALARWTGHPLLCKGDDFARTDLELVRF